MPPCGWAQLWINLDAAMIRFMRTYGVMLLRVALGIVFVGFGALKVIGRSPVGALVAGTVYWVNPRWFVPFLGLWEMAGTMLTLAIRPDPAFQDENPLLLTVTGEFVITNLVLISAGIVTGSTVSPPRK